MTSRDEQSSHGKASEGTARDPLRALHEAEERYRLAARATNDIIWDFDASARQIIWNEALTRHFGHAPEGSVTPVNWWRDHIHPGDRDKVWNSFEAASGGPSDYWAEEYRFARADGSYAYVLDRGYMIRDAGGKVVRMVGAMLDQSERKRAEAAIRASEERLRLAQEAIGLGTFEWDLDAGAMVASDVALRIIGVDAPDGRLTPARLLAIAHPDDRNGLRAHLDRAAKGQGPTSYQYRVTRPSDGEVRWISINARNYTDDQGYFIRRIGVVEDITDRKLAEARLRETEENYRYTVELSPQLAWTADPDGSNVEFKQPFSSFPSLSLPEGNGDLTDQLTHPDDRAYRRREWEISMRSGRPYDVEFRVRRSDGGYRWVRARGWPRRDDAGRVVKWYGITEDIHPQRVAEQQLQRLQDELSQVARVSAMGTLASALAHELNQPLTAVANYMAGSKRLLTNHGQAATPVILEALDHASKAAVQAGEIVRRLRDLVARGKVSRQPVDLPALISETCELTLGELRERAIGLSVELGADTRMVLADRIQIQQVFANLLRNAAEAMEKAPTRVVTIIAAPSADDQVLVRVEDTGPGVPAEMKRHLFSPFVSTKATGMGVGLSICRSIVEAHGGQLWVEDAPTGGAAFCFTLPKAPPDANDSSDSPPP